MIEELKREYLVETHKNNLTIWYVLKGPKGAAVFNIHLIRSTVSHFVFRVAPLDVCTHSKQVQYPEQAPYGPCEFLDSETCYGTRDEPAATELWRKALDENDEEVIWKELERRYQELI